MTRAYYNEIGPFAATWLRELIAAGHVAPGDVDTRSIEDVSPDDLRPYAQCHFFAGIGVWSHALRLAGWPDDRPVWTGSCPCQPFSAAGKGAGFADERHLWPAWFHLVGERRPSVLFGEQVASLDGLGWFDLVSADLEGAGYARGVADLCAAGVGAPHIRQRLYFGAGRVEHDARDGRLERRAKPVGRGVVGGRGAGRLDDDDAGLEGQRGGHSTARGRIGAARSTAEAGQSGRMALPDGRQRDGFAGGEGCVGHRAAPGRLEGDREPERGGDVDDRPCPTDGFWRAADWLACRDGKWRPVEPGSFPLAHGTPARVGRLRGYGNAIVPQVAAAFIRAWLDARQPVNLFD